MIITRSPLRISIGGGATDLQSFYKNHGGFCVSAAINKYVYTVVHRTFEEEVVLKYSQMENVEKIDEVKHPIFRECLRLLDFKTPQIEIVSFADVPAGTGLGSSSSFTCALLKSLYAHRNKHILPDELAKLACFVEIDVLKGNLGKQDQTISAYGGLQCMTFHTDNSVTVEKLNMSVDDIYNFQDRMLLFFTGFRSETNTILKDQVDKTKQNDDKMIENLLKIKEMGYKSKELLENGDVLSYGELMLEHWMSKKERSPGMTNSEIDKLYEIGLNNGAIGGKLIGSGGGGFLMFIAKDPFKLRKIMQKNGLEELRYSFDFEGTKRIN